MADRINREDENSQDIEKAEETMVENDLGEELTENHLMEIAKKIRLLNEKIIDDLFFDCGFKEKGKGKNKSLSKDTILEIKKDNEEAFGWIVKLFQETPKEEFLYVVRDKLAIPLKIEFDEVDDEKDLD